MMKNWRHFQIFTSTVVAIECKLEGKMCASLCSWKVRCVLHFVDENRVVHEVYQWTQQKDRIRKL